MAGQRLNGPPQDICGRLTYCSICMNGVSCTRDWSVHQARANACAFQMHPFVLSALQYCMNAAGLAWEGPHTRQLSSDAGSVPSVWQDVWQAAQRSGKHWEPWQLVLLQALSQWPARFTCYLRGPTAMLHSEVSYWTAIGVARRIKLNLCASSTHCKGCFSCPEDQLSGDQHPGTCWGIKLQALTEHWPGRVM